MKKVIGLVVLGVFFIASLGICCEQESGEAKGSMMGSKEGWKSGKMGKCHGMMKKKMMMGRELIATKDGGVVVLVGNKLMKYDKKLNLIGEAQIEMDMEGMMQKCREMMKKCGMEEKSE